jgi:Derlin-2/3
MDDVVEFYTSIPIFTRIYITAATVAAVSASYNGGMELMFSKRLVLAGEWWRLLTTFVFFGKLSAHIFFQLRFIYDFFPRLESHFYFNRPGEFLWMCVKLAAMLLVVVWMGWIQAPFLSFSFIKAILYIFSRRYPHERLAMFGVIPMQAPFMPLFFIGFGWVLDGLGAVQMDLLGFAVGHIVWYLSDVVPEIIGFDPTLPPKSIRRALFGLADE